jgi:hypothetical protein
MAFLFISTKNQGHSIKKKTKESFFLATRSFIGDEGEPSGHEGRLEQVRLVHHNAADLCLGIQREGQRIEPLKVELEGLAVRQQGLQLLNLLLAVDVLPRHGLDERHQPVHELVLAVQEGPPLLPVGRTLAQRLGEPAQDGPVHVLDLKAVFRIHDILVWIRIRGSMPLTIGSGSCYFRH